MLTEGGMCMNDEVIIAIAFDPTFIIEVEDIESESDDNDDK